MKKKKKMVHNEMKNWKHDVDWMMNSGLILRDQRLYLN